MTASSFLIIATCAAIFSNFSSASPIAAKDDFRLPETSSLQSRDEVPSTLNATKPLGIPPDPYEWRYPPYRVVLSDYENPSSDFQDFQGLLINLGEKIRNNLRRARGDFNAPWPERQAICISERFAFLLTPPMEGASQLTIADVESVASALFNWGLAFGRFPIPSIGIKVYMAPAPQPVALGSMVIQPDPPATVAQVQTSK